MKDIPICFVFGAGPRCAVSPRPAPDDFVIAADGGQDYARAEGIPIDWLIGDLDSSTGTIPDEVPVEILPREKDDTDMEAAIELGWSRGYRTFHIYGGVGGRLDHTLANIQCVARLAGRGGCGSLFDRETVITALHSGRIRFPMGGDGVVSVFAHTDLAEGVYEVGLKYPLTDATLCNTDPIGVSNELTGSPGEISVRKGIVVVIYPRNTTITINITRA